MQDSIGALCVNLRGNLIRIVNPDFCDQPQAHTAASRRCQLEAATLLLSMLVGGSLIPILFYRDGAGLFRLNTYSELLSAVVYSSKLPHAIGAHLEDAGVSVEAEDCSLVIYKCL